MRSRVEPSHATPHDHDVNFPFQIRLVQVGDLEFAPRARVQRLRNGRSLAVIEIKSSHREIRFRLLGLLLDAQRMALFVELDNAVTFRIENRIREDGRSILLLRRLAQVLREIMSVENVVAQHQRAGTAANEALADDERLCQSLGPGLNRHIAGEGQTGCRLAAASETCGTSSGVEIIRMSRIPASISVLNG